LEWGDGRAVEQRGTGRVGLTRRDFFAEVVERLRAELDGDLAAFQHAATQNLVKIYFANPRVHYEVWLNSQQRATEVGLHFEDGPESTAAYLSYFDRRIVELKHELGTEVELERWTPSWGHLYELAPLETPSEALARRTARRLARMISVLQPLVEDAAVPAERSTRPSEPFDPAKRWRKFRR
jgi:hypothetical protein